MQSFTITYNVDCKFELDTLYHIEKVPLFIPSLRVFMLMFIPSLEFSNAFCASPEMIIRFLSFILLTGFTLTDFQMLNQPCIPGIKR